MYAMARRALARSTTRTVYVPRVRYIRRGRRRAFTRRNAVAFATGLPPTATAVAGAALLAWGTKDGNFMTSWHVGNLGVPLTVGLAAWLLGRWMHMPILKHMATGMLSVAAYEAVKSGALLGAGDGGYDDVSGLAADV